MGIRTNLQLNSRNKAKISFTLLPLFVLLLLFPSRELFADSYCRILKDSSVSQELNRAEEVEMDQALLEEVRNLQEPAIQDLSIQLNSRNTYLWAENDSNLELFFLASSVFTDNLNELYILRFPSKTVIDDFSCADYNYYQNTVLKNRGRMKSLLGLMSTENPDTWVPVNMEDFLGGISNGMDTRWGEALIQMEALAYESRGLEYPVDEMHFVYKNLIMGIRSSISNLPEKNFKSIVSALRYQLIRRPLANYCAARISMKSALLGDCTNCQGQTYLFLAALLDSGVYALSPEQFKAEVFTDHVRPVLWNEEKGEILDLVYAKKEVRNESSGELISIGNLLSGFLLRRGSQLNSKLFNTSIVWGGKEEYQSGIWDHFQSGPSKSQVREYKYRERLSRLESLVPEKVELIANGDLNFYSFFEPKNEFSDDPSTLSFGLAEDSDSGRPGRGRRLGPGSDRPNALGLNYSIDWDSEATSEDSSSRNSDTSNAFGAGGGLAGVDFKPSLYTEVCDSSIHLMELRPLEEINEGRMQAGVLNAASIVNQEEMCRLENFVRSNYQLEDYIDRPLLIDLGSQGQQGAMIDIKMELPEKQYRELLDLKLAYDERIKYSFKMLEEVYILRLQRLEKKIRRRDTDFLDRLYQDFLDFEHLQSYVMSFDRAHNIGGWNGIYDQFPRLFPYYKKVVRALFEYSETIKDNPDDFLQRFTKLELAKVNIRSGLIHQTAYFYGHVLPVPEFVSPNVFGLDPSLPDFWLKHPLLFEDMSEEDSARMKTMIHRRVLPYLLEEAILYTKERLVLKKEPAKESEEKLPKEISKESDINPPVVPVDDFEKMKAHCLEGNTHYKSTFYYSCEKIKQEFAEQDPDQKVMEEEFFQKLFFIAKLSPSLRLWTVVLQAGDLEFYRNLVKDGYLSRDEDPGDIFSMLRLLFTDYLAGFSPRFIPVALPDGMTTDDMRMEFNNFKESKNGKFPSLSESVKPAKAFANGLMYHYYKLATDKLMNELMISDSHYLSQQTKLRDEVAQPISWIIGTTAMAKPTIPESTSVTICLGPGNPMGGMGFIYFNDIDDFYLDCTIASKSLHQ